MIQTASDREGTCLSCHPLHLRATLSNASGRAKDRDLGSEIGHQSMRAAKYYFIHYYDHNRQQAFLDSEIINDDMWQYAHLLATRAEGSWPLLAAWAINNLYEARVNQNALNLVF